MSLPQNVPASPSKPILEPAESQSSPRAQPSRIIRLLKWVPVVIAFGAGWWAANARLHQQHRDVLPEASQAVDRRTAAVSVTAQPIEHRLVNRTVDVLGTLHGFEEVTISARVEGRVLKLNCDVGDSITPKALLLEIDSTDHALAVQQAEKALHVELAKLGLKQVPDAKTDLTKVPVVAKAKSLLEHAKSRFDRMTQLAAKKTVSLEDVETSASDYRTAQAEYDHQMLQTDAGLAMIQLKQVDLEIAREQLANTKVTAPIPNVALPNSVDVTYVVSKRSVSEGTLVRPGTELFQIVIADTLKLRVPVPERYSTEVQLNQSVKIFTSSSKTSSSGTVTRIHPTVDVTTRTYVVEIQVPNSSGDLKPGGFAKASILTHLDSNAATVPLSALVQFAGITKIFVVENGRAKEIPVTLGAQTTEWVEIASPSLPDGTQVVTSGQTAIANDWPVIVRTPEESASKHDSNSKLPTEGASAAEVRGHRE